MGGPEASYDAVHLMDELPEVELIMQGEGEETFTRLVEACECGTEVCFSELPGIVLRRSDGTIEVHRPAPLMNLDDIPFSYGDLSGLEHRIIYYESSRGCPFSCSYCLSSIDKKVRFRSLSLVTRELQFFLDRKVPQVKFVDRTFNCKKSHSMAIWQYLLEHDNGITIYDLFDICIAAFACVHGIDETDASGADSVGNRRADDEPGGCEGDPEDDGSR